MSSTTVPNPANGSFPSRSCRLSAGWPTMLISKVYMTLLPRLLGEEQEVAVGVRWCGLATRWVGLARTRTTCLGISGKIIFDPHYRYSHSQVLHWSWNSTLVGKPPAARALPLPLLPLPWVPPGGRGTSVVWPEQVAGRLRRPVSNLSPSFINSTSLPAIFQNMLLTKVCYKHGCLQVWEGLLPWGTLQEAFACGCSSVWEDTLRSIFANEVIRII